MAPLWGMMIRSTCDLVEQIRPELPENFEAMTQTERQDAIDGQRSLLKVRRNLVELIAGQRILRGEIMQHEADAEMIHQQLAQNEALPEGKRLPEHRVRHLAGRQAVAHAQAERGQELIEQYEREIALYRQLLEAS